MSKMTFVVEFEDGKEPSVGAGMEVAGGRLVAAMWSDYRDDFFSEEQKDSIVEIIEEAEWHDQISEEKANELIEKLDLLTI